jgi:hypothetical protein
MEMVTKSYRTIVLVVLVAMMNAPWSASAAQLSTPDEVVWDWLDQCDNSKTLTVEITFDNKTIYKSSVPICRLRRGDIQVERKQKRLVFFLEKEEKKSLFGEPKEARVEGNIWKAGGEPDAIILGVSFATKERIWLNTLHLAFPEKASWSELSRNLYIQTYHLSASIDSARDKPKDSEAERIVVQILKEDETPLPEALVTLVELKGDEFVKTHFRDMPVDHLARFTVPSSVLNTLPKGSEIFIHSQDGFYWQSVETDSLQVKGKTAKIVVKKTGIISGTVMKFPSEIRDPVVIEADKKGDDGKYSIVAGIGIGLSIGRKFTINGLSSGVYKIQVKKSYDSSEIYFVKEGVDVVIGKNTNIGNLVLK